MNLKRNLKKKLIIFQIYIKNKLYYYMIQNIGFFGSCQLHMASSYFFNEEVLNNNNLKILVNLPFYEYDEKHPYYKNDKLNYEIFDNLDVLIIENNISKLGYQSNKAIK